MATWTVTETATVTAPATCAETQPYVDLINAWLQVILNLMKTMALGALVIALYYHGDALGAFIVELIHGHRVASERRTILAVFEAIRQARVEAGLISEDSYDSDESEKPREEEPCVVDVD